MRVFQYHYLVKQKRRSLMNAVSVRYVESLLQLLRIALKRHGRMSHRVFLQNVNFHSKSKIPVGIVLQGPIENESSRKYLKDSLIELNRVFPPEQIVISTWESSKIDESDIDGLASIVKSSDFGLKHNFQRQLRSASAGLRFLKNQGLPYVVKQRVDQRIGNLDSYNFILKNLQFFGEDRILFTSRNSFYSRLFGFSDMFTFSTVENQILFWSDEVNSYGGFEWDPIAMNMPRERIIWQGTNLIPWSESWLNLRFAMIRCFKFSSSAWLDNIKYFKESCILVNSDYLDQQWHKDRVRTHTSSLKLMFHEGKFDKHREWSFEDWISVYLKGGSDDQPSPGSFF